MQVPSPLRSAKTSAAAAMARVSSIAATAQSNNDSGGGGRGLHARLMERHKEAMRAFEEEIYTISESIDAKQQQQLLDLRSSLQCSHSATAAALSQAEQTLRKSEAQLNSHLAVLRDAALDDVLAPYADAYHLATDVVSNAAMRERITADRLRVVGLLCVIHDGYQERVKLIEETAVALMAQEDDRRQQFQQLLRRLMDSLTSIAVSSTTETQVLAQRVLHHVNQQLGDNYLTAQTLCIQLRQREGLKRRQYQQTLVQLYRSTQSQMTTQHCAWAATLLQSSVYRRPPARLQAVQEVQRLLTQIVTEVSQFVTGLTTTVESLRETVPATVTAEQQICGGSGAIGWLRSYTAATQRPDVFGSPGPEEVVAELEMRGSVVVRNAQARCQAIGQRMAVEEAARVKEASALVEAVAADIEWICTPLAEELPLLQAASLDATILDDALAVLTTSHQVIQHAEDGHEAVSLKMLEGRVQDVDREGKWVQHFVASGLQAGYERLSDRVLVLPDSLLALTESATKTLIEIGQQMLGTSRLHYKSCREKKMDYYDEVAAMEKTLRAIEMAIAHAETPATAEVLFGEGLECLQNIALIHGHFHRDTRQRIEVLTKEVHAVVELNVQLMEEQVGVRPYVEEVKEEANEEAESTTAGTASVISGVTEEQPARKRPESTIASTSGRRSYSADELTTATLPPPVLLQTRSGMVFVVLSDTFHFALQRPPTSSPGLAQSLATTTTTVATSTREALRTAASPPPPPLPSAATVVAAAAAAAPPPPSIAFMSYYEGLLTELGCQEVFITTAAVQQWNDVLRRELLEWVLVLRESVLENWGLWSDQLQCTISKEVSDVLRYHRRRPATLQADFFEARVRELDLARNRADKQLNRILERVAKVQHIQSDLVSSPAQDLSDGVILAEVKAVLSKLKESPSMNALHMLEHRYATLCGQYTAALSERCAAALDGMKKMQEVINLECQQLMQERSSATNRASSDEPDPILQRVAILQQQLEATMAATKAEVEKVCLEREKKVEAMQAEFAALCTQNAAELQLFQSVKEAIVRLKTQVQGSLSTSNAEEAALNVVIQQVDDLLRIPVQQYSLQARVEALLLDDVQAVHQSNAAVTGQLPDIDDVQRDIRTSIEAAKAEAEGRVEGNSTLRLFACLDQVRPMLYGRGSKLDVLTNAVELWAATPSHYVLPPPLTTEQREGGGSTSGPARSLSVQRNNKRHKLSKAVSVVGNSSSSAAMLAAALPEARSWKVQIEEWIAAAMSDVSKAVEAHVAIYPGPLARRIAGMKNGDPSSLVEAARAQCAAQEERLRLSVEAAILTYRQQVQRLSVLSQSLPPRLTEALYAVVMGNLAERVAGIIATWQHLLLSTRMQRYHNRDQIKVSVAAQLQSSELDELARVEARRSFQTLSLLHSFWGWTLREIQDESGLHMARCWNSLKTFTNLMRGVITPQHLTQALVAVEGGQHRGLQYLLMLRERANRAAAAQDGIINSSKDGRLQETMLLHRFDAAAAGGGGGAKVKGDGGKDARGAAEGGLPLLPLPEAELPGLPVNSVAPLVSYNRQFPDNALDVPLGATPYVAVQAAVESKTAPKRSATTSKRKARSSVADVQSSATGSTDLTTPPLHVPQSALYMEFASLIREVVDAAAVVASDAASDISSAFQIWLDEELQWRHNWTLLLAELRGTSQNTM